ncbi:hypothetical protein KBZ10_03870 [Streptomyces sp. F63]|uniref:hypothetical protein n=1 Tax=Streptomyces sp. F63 TaxID=2824887 RepID=UPI001B39C79C|nr:hypothetical protein [Streptomyces sp. F63]MBQ0983673.1 hypothetical protein [Streptomyces sp. F63]
MTWEEWERLKTEAAGGDGVGVRVNNAPPAGGGGGSSDLVVRSDELGKLGDMARDLRQRLSTDGDYARPATYDAAIELIGDDLDLGSALLEEHDAWNTKLTTLKEACAHISNHLDYSRGVHAEDEKKIATDMRNADGRKMTVSRIYDYIK